MPTILVSGSSSGLGLAFLKAYATDPSNTIISLDRQPLSSDVSSTCPVITHHILDITSTPSIAALGTILAKTPIDLFIHSIGVRGLVPHLTSLHPTSTAPAESLDAMDEATLLQTFHTNAAATFLLIRALLPSLLLTSNPKVVVMSSRMGSLSANTTGGGYAYRASKAALNAIVRSFSIDVPEVVFVLCHPGRVESGLVGFREEGAIGAEEAVAGLVRLVEGWGRGDSGGFYDRFGDRIEW